jgi:hypothetical protein
VVGVAAAEGGEHLVGDRVVGDRGDRGLGFGGWGDDLHGRHAPDAQEGDGGGDADEEAGDDGERLIVPGAEAPGEVGETVADGDKDGEGNRIKPVAKGAPFIQLEDKSLKPIHGRISYFHAAPGQGLPASCGASIYRTIRGYAAGTTLS